MIPVETVEQIHQTAIIEDVVGDYVELKKQGSSYRGLSPFTNEKTPSFYVVPSKGIFKCFSSGKGGSLMTFVMEVEKVSYPEALRIVARKYNIEIVEKDPLPSDQLGKPHVFKRLTSAENEIPVGLKLEQIYDRIRMVDHADYPNAFIIYGDIKIELTKARLAADSMEVKCVIKKLS